jgi:hypothetical protein
MKIFVLNRHRLGGTWQGGTELQMPAGDQFYCFKVAILSCSAVHLAKQGPHHQLQGSLEV